MPDSVPSGPVPADLVIEISGRVSMSDFRAADRLCRNAWTRIKFSLHVLFLVTMILAGLAYVAAGMRHDNTVTMGVGGAVAVLFVFFLATLVTGFVRGRQQLERIATQEKGCFAYSQSRIDKHAIQVATNSVVTTTKWEAFRGYRECPEVVILFPQEGVGQAMLVARSKFKSEDDWQAFRQIMMGKLRPV